MSCGWGGPLPHFACELLKLQGQADINVVPYKGNAPAMNDLIGGRIDLLLDVPNVALPQVKANRVRAIATTNPKRGTGPFGHLPTVNETLAGFEFEGWQGVLAPAGTPREIVERLNREIAAVLSRRRRCANALATGDWTSHPDRQRHLRRSSSATTPATRGSSARRGSGRSDPPAGSPTAA